MPRVNRFRIVNFKFDDNRKLIADEMFEMDRCNTLVNLENGGGKSAMLQLALQVMLPNSQLGSRKMIDYFDLNSGTLHVLMEWCLDTAGMSQQYLLTGFCCQRGQEGIDYFTYIHPHTRNDDYSIDNMPVINEKREVTGYHAFYRYIQSLSRESSARMNFFRQNEQSKYRTQLETYNLFEDEFRAIQTINQSEGGIEKFFEKARTSRQVIERLIIPSIPSGNEEDSGVLVDSLRKHMDNLKTIPELQSRIKIYDDFCKRAEGFLSHVRKYAKLYEEHRRKAQNILNLENLLHLALNRSSKENEEYFNKKNEAEANKKELLFMKESLSYSRNFHEVETNEKSLEQLNSTLADFNLQLEKLELEYNNSLSVNDWLDMNEIIKKLRVKEAELMAKQQEKEERNDQYQRILPALAFLYTEKLKEIKKELELLSDKKNKHGKEIDKQESLKADIIDKIKKTENELYHIAKDQKKLEDEARQIFSQIENGYNLLLMEPEQSLLKLANDIESLDNEVEKLNREILKMDEKKESIGTEINRTETKIALNYKDREIMEDELSNIKKVQGDLESKIRNYETGTSVYDSTVIEKIRTMIENQRSEYNRILSSQLALKNKQLAFSDGEGYIPDYAIKRLVDLFNENEINAVAGSIWLANQNEKIRDCLVENNPYLPYSVIISEKSIDSIAFLEDKIINCVEGYPVLILTGGGQAIVYSGLEHTESLESSEKKERVEGLSGEDAKQNGHIDSEKKKEDKEPNLLEPAETGSEQTERKRGPTCLFNKEIFILNSEAAEFTVNADKFRVYARKISGSINKLDDSLKIKQEEISALENFLNDLNKFIAEYPEILVRRKEAELEEKKAETKESEKLLESLKKQLDNIKEESAGLSGKINEIKAQSNHFRNQKKLMEQYIERSEEIREREKETAQLKNELKKFRDSLSSVEKELEKMESKLSEYKDRAALLEKEEFDFSKRLDDVKSRTDGSYMVEETGMPYTFIVKSKKIDGSYEIIETHDSIGKLEARKIALEKELGDVNADYLQELIQNYRNNISGYENGIKERGTDRSWLETKGERVPEIKLNELCQKMQELKNEIKNKVAEKNSLELDIGILADRMKNLEGNIRKAFGKEPRLFDRITGEQERQIEEGISAEERKIKRLEVKLADIGQRVESLKKIIDRVSEFINDNELKKFSDAAGESIFRTKNRTIDRWDIASISDRDIASFYNEAKNRYKTSENELEASRKVIENEFDLLYEDSELNANQNIKGLMSRIGKIDIFNYEIIEQIFQNVFKSIENLKQAAQAQLENLDKDRREMILRCLRRARTIYDEVKSVDGFSKITIGDKKERAIKIKVPPYFEEQAESLMGQYLDLCINELTHMRSDSRFDPARLEDEIRKRMKPTNLLDAIAPLNLFRIDVLKPGHNMGESRYIEWENILSWSGGEKLAGFFAMFIAIISYLRYKKTRWYESSKVIWIDNPFGQANAGYLLDYIFELAKTTNTQVICLTGLQEVAIYEKFDVVYSLVHRMLGAGSSVIKSTKVKENTGINTGMYKVKHTQMSLLSLQE